MPIYEYQCSACGHKLESIQKISEDPLKLCPECHKNTLKKLVSAAGFQLKGGGWYATDYSSKNKKSKKDGAAAEGKGGTSTETKKDSSTSSSGTSEK